VAEADEAIVSLYHKLNANEKINQELSDDDVAVMRKAQEANNGEKFMSLWNGDIFGYRTKSEADLALCEILSFWTNGNSEQILRLFRESGLYRPKWENSETYRNATISKASTSLA